MKGDTDWTAAKVSTLRSLWADPRNSSAEIGRKLNISKNAVLGKAHRLGLPSRPSPIRPRGTAKPATMPKRNSGAGKKMALALPAGALLEVSKAPTAPKAEPPKPQRVGSVRQCCFPIGEPGRPGFYFCGEPAKPERRYCQAHCDIAYVPLVKWRRQNFISKAAAGASAEEL